MTPTAFVFSESIGLMLCDTKTSELFNGKTLKPLILSAAASPASPSASPGNDEDKPMNDGSGPNLFGALAYFDPDTSSLKMCQDSLVPMLDDSLPESFGTWPRAGTMRSGIVSPQVPLVPLTRGIESGLWPTPRAESGVSRKPGTGGKCLQEEARKWPTPRSTDGSHGGRVTPRKSREGGNLIEAVSARFYPTPQAGANNPAAHHAVSGDFKTKLCEAWGIPTTGQLNPMWVEWLMGFPIGWTDCGD